MATPQASPLVAVADLDEQAARTELIERILAAADRQGLNNTQAARASGVRRQDFIKMRQNKADRSLGWLMQALASLEPGLRVRLVVEPRAGQ
jgi:hypothetical protein